MSDTPDAFGTEKITIQELNLSKYRLPSYVFWGENLTRPTFSFAIGCKLWSRERQYYEQDRERNMAPFATRPYLYHQYPELHKHYPGTWRVAEDRELNQIVQRLTRPTRSSYSREQDIQSAYPPSSRSGTAGHRGKWSPDGHVTRQRSGARLPRVSVLSPSSRRRSQKGDDDYLDKPTSEPANRPENSDSASEPEKCPENSDSKSEPKNGSQNSDITGQ